MLDDTQRALMGFLAEDSFGLWDLAWLGSERPQAAKASRALLDLYRRGYVDLYAYVAEGEGVEERPIDDREEAEERILDLENWASPIDRPRRLLYTAFVTVRGTEAWERSVDDPAGRG